MMPPTDLSWEFASTDDLGRDASILHPDERRRLAGFSSPNRQTEFIAGRALAKRLVTKAVPELAKVPWKDLEIRSLDSLGVGCSPSVFHENERVPLSLSISHTSLHVAVACIGGLEQPVGIDVLDHGAQMTPSVLWFTKTEREMLQRSDSLLALSAQFFSCKETAYKAFGSGNGFQPRRWEVRSLDANRTATVVFQEHPAHRIQVNCHRISDGSTISLI